MTKIIGLGAGGHAKGIIEILQENPELTLAGMLDPDPSLRGESVLGVPVLGGDDLLGKLLAEGVTHAFIGVGSVGNANGRRKLYEKLLALGLEPAQVIHSKAILSPSARLGAGVTVMAGAIINAEAVIGDNVIVNTGAIIEHDCAIGAHSHIATGARLAGGVQVGIGSHIGVGASVRQGIRIGANAVVGAGAAVVSDVPDNVVVAGVPAHFLRNNLPL